MQLYTEDEPENCGKNAQFWQKNGGGVTPGELRNSYGGAPKDAGVRAIKLHEPYLRHSVVNWGFYRWIKIQRYKMDRAYGSTP